MFVFRRHFAGERLSLVIVLAVGGHQVAAGAGGHVRVGVVSKEPGLVEGTITGFACNTV